MNSVNNDFFGSFQLNENLKSKQVEKNILLVENIFKFPNLVLDFQNKLNKWDTKDSYNTKPGLEAILPYWTGYVILEKIQDLINIELAQKNSYEVSFNYFYKQNIKNDLRSSSHLPHIDASFLNNSNIKRFIFLVNLNSNLTSTKFWKYKGKKFQESYEEYVDYENFVKNCNNQEEYFKNQCDCKSFNDIQYAFNSAIIYPANIYHSAVVENFYTTDTPRVMFRIEFSLKQKYFQKSYY